MGIHNACTLLLIIVPLASEGQAQSIPPPQQGLHRDEFISKYEDFRDREEQVRDKFHAVLGMMEPLHPDQLDTVEADIRDAFREGMFLFKDTETFLMDSSFELWNNLFKALSSDEANKGFPTQPLPCSELHDYVKLLQGAPVDKVEAWMFLQGDMDCMTQMLKHIFSRCQELVNEYMTRDDALLLITDTLKSLGSLAQVGSNLVEAVKVPFPNLLTNLAGTPPPVMTRNSKNTDELVTQLLKRLLEARSAPPKPKPKQKKSLSELLRNALH